MDKEIIDKSYLVDGTLVEFIKSTEIGLYENEPLDIILFVSGYLVGGQLISHKEWYKNQVNEVEIENKEDKEEEKENTDSQQDESRVEDYANERRFIHLKNAKFIHGNTQIPQNTDGFYWRGKLSAVDGFAFGALVLTKSEKSPKVIRINGQVIEID